MKNDMAKTGVSPIRTPRSALRTRSAFTLIELLIVVAIIAILAALIMPITFAVNRQKIRNRTKTELAQIESAIENYKSKHNFYPPDNPGDPMFLNQLYYELSGTTLKNGVYTTLDGNATINVTSLPGAFGPAATMTGFVNSMQGTGGDEGIIAQNFLKGLSPSQIGDLKLAKILVGSVGWPTTGPQIIPRPPAAKTGLNPWRYVLTGATNNPTKFDLWIDVMVGSKTNRICNWSDQPIVL
jgi:prepilin-type N-terminal cleavage/methylation domain-containing protein